MGPKPTLPATSPAPRPRLDEQIDLGHPLVRLGALIDWHEIERSFGAHFVCRRGRPALRARLVAGLLYLQHTFNASDEAVVQTWVENPYWQYLTGEMHLQTRAPMDPSSLTRWRRRIGEEGVELLLKLTIEAAHRGGFIERGGFERVIVDTTVMLKAVAHPTDSRLLEKSRQHLLKAAHQQGLKVRQSYARIAPRLAAQVGRYAHARQFRRMRAALRMLRSRVGRLHREVSRQLGSMCESARLKVSEVLARTGRILAQRPKDKGKLYALHAPEVECISKGKAATPYEFGVKVTVSSLLRQGFVVGMRSMPGNPYDGHTLPEALEQVAILTGCKPTTAVVDKGFRGVEVEGVRILRSGQKRGLTRGLRAMIRRRSAIEPTIGHMKMDGRLARNPLKGNLGDAIHAVLCGAGHNLRLLIARRRLGDAAAAKSSLRAA